MISQKGIAWRKHQVTQSLSLKIFSWPTLASSISGTQSFGVLRFLLAAQGVCESSKNSGRNWGALRKPLFKQWHARTSRKGSLLRRDSEGSVQRDSSSTSHDNAMNEGNVWLRKKAQKVVELILALEEAAQACACYCQNAQITPKFLLQPIVLSYRPASSPLRICWTACLTSPPAQNACVECSFS